MEDLWPSDIGTTTLRSPVSILREQASALAQKTQGLVTAEVITRARKRSDAWHEWEDGLTHEFVLVAPTLDRYRFELFSLGHDELLYPVTGNFNEQESELADEAALMEWLRGIFFSERTKRIIHSLLAQAKVPVAS